MALVSDARSKMVALETDVDIPTSRNVGEKWGTLGTVSYTKLPNDFSAISWPLRVTAIEAAGKARVGNGLRRIENAREKTLSCSSKAKAEVPGCIPRLGLGGHSESRSTGLSSSHCDQKGTPGIALLEPLRGLCKVRTFLTI